ncbi:MAG: glycine cleavage system aminomethyltransferase GcvT [Anaerolineales bacterium]|nr:glycine cleavage system aminomethyltransferase GcvT [Anaerolineales bacterium]
MLEFFQKYIENVDPAVAHLIDFEAERQARKLILIPSESQAPVAVRQALGSVFQNIYAEGYPDPEIRGLPENDLLDYAYQLARYRRYSDRRYYKGVEYVDILETLAQRRAAEAFSTKDIPPEDIWVNVQPLSGSPANGAVYTALIPPGSTIMAMNLFHGGHLTHGSPANRSGRLFQVVPYGVDPETELLDYDLIEEMARRHKPKMIIAGYTSYPWMPDWARFRQIAESVGAFLMADIAHTAGLVVAGVAPSPIGHAHVISCTTHKTLYGPRGAIIVTTDKTLSDKVDAAVFPGEQGGPHLNAIAGMAVSFKWAQSDQFIQLQKQVKQNAAHLAAALKKHGLRIPYGGTDTHLLLVDCKSVRSENGVGPDGKKGVPLMGDMAARILDLVGIVLNRNSIPGDTSARNPSGIRMGTPWITQRGLQGSDIERLAEIIARVLKSTRPYAYTGRSGPIYRAKMDFDVLEQAKWDVMDLAHHADLAQDYVPSGYPHHFFMHNPPTNPEAEWDIIEISGPANVRGFLNVALTNDVYALGEGASQPTWILEPDGRLMSGGVLKRPGPETTRFQLLIPKNAEPRVAHWLRALSDGYVNMDGVDLFIKTPGPVVIHRLSHQLAGEWKERPPDKESFAGHGAGWAFHKPYWIGIRAVNDAPPNLAQLPYFDWKKDGSVVLRKSSLHALYCKSGVEMVSFAGWQAPLHFSSRQKEHQAVRQAAGLFDVGHMGLFEFQGENIHLFLNTLVTNDVTLLKPGESQYSFMLAPDGSVLDDVWIYRLDDRIYWLAANAANTERDWAWVNAVREGTVCIDTGRPWARSLGTDTVSVRNVGEIWTQIAIQGPRSRDILAAMMDESDSLLTSLLDMKRNEIVRGQLAGHDIYLSRTGYTGENFGYEIFVHPAAAPALWYTLLEEGKPFGLEPVGLRARDSLRIEAGLPYYGNELSGPLGLNPADAGLGSFVKLYKPFFIGKMPYLAHEQERKAEIIRFRLVDEFGRMPGQNDIIVSLTGEVVGKVTSCSMNGEGVNIGLGYVQQGYTARGTRLGVLKIDEPNQTGLDTRNLKTGDRVQLHDEILVINRFMDKE